MYATIHQANNYVNRYYSSADPLRIAWSQLSDSDKQILLNRAEQLIDRLSFTGVPLNPNKAFPRNPLKEQSIQAATNATIELALQGQDEEARERYRMQKQGVRSYKIGDLSETYVGGSSVSEKDEHTYSIVYPWLKDWLSGGYQLCQIRR